VGPVRVGERSMRYKYKNTLASVNVNNYILNLAKKKIIKVWIEMKLHVASDETLFSPIENSNMKKKLIE
jgi:hypothetical protein